jgi:hypothetical protein
MEPKPVTKIQLLEKFSNHLMKKEILGIADMALFLPVMKNAELILVVSSYALLRRYIQSLDLKIQKLIPCYG